MSEGHRDGAARIVMEGDRKLRCGIAAVHYVEIADEGGTHGEMRKHAGVHRRRRRIDHHRDIQRLSEHGVPDPQVNVKAPIALAPVARVPIAA